MCRIVLMTLGAATLVVVPGRAEEKARQLMKAATIGNLAETEQYTMSLQLIDARKEVRNRSLFFQIRKGAQGDHRALAHFSDPAWMKGMGLLTLQSAREEDRQWLYMPVYKKVRRIVSSDRKARFAGTDFTYEDMKIENLHLYRYSLAPAITTIRGRRAWELTAVPVKEQVALDTGYSKRILSIDEETKVIVRCKYHDVAGRLVKVLNAFEIRPSDDKRTIFRAHKSIMYDIRRRHRTILQLSHLKIGADVPESTFTVFRLRQGK